MGTGCPKKSLAILIICCETSVSYTKYFLLEGRWILRDGRFAQKAMSCGFGKHGLGWEIL